MIDKDLIEKVRFSVKLSEIVSKYTVLKPDRRGWHTGLCPFHKENTPSFRLSDERGRYKCFGCGTAGDVFDFIMQVEGLSFPEVFAQLSKGPLTGGYSSVVKSPEGAKIAAQIDDNKRIAHAHALWLKRLPVAGTLAERYLRLTRSISVPINPLLGFVQSAYCSVFSEELPALVAPLQDSNGHVTAVQQIFLSGETDDAYLDSRGHRIKRTLGAMRDGCVRLGMPDLCLGLAGSVEDALAASELYSLPVWATCGEHRLPNVWIPDEITQLYIFADADDTGRACAEAARKAHPKITVSVMTPKRAKDWNEYLTAEKAA